MQNRKTLSQCSPSRFDTLEVIDFPNSAVGLPARGGKCSWERLVRHESEGGASLTLFALSRSRTARTVGTLTFTSLFFRLERRPPKKSTRYASYGLRWSRKSLGPTTLRIGNVAWTTGR